MTFVFRKQDTKEIAAEFTQLAAKLDNCFLSEFAGLCFLGVAKCNEFEDDAFISYLKASRSFVKADKRKTELGFLNNHELLEGANRSYFQALTGVKDSVMKACIIREMRELVEVNNNLMLTSDLQSPCHRIYDLEKASNENIKSNDFIGALEKLTEIIDDISERKEVKSFYDVVQRNEVSRLILLLLLELPPSRQSPSSLKLLEKYTWNNESFDIEMASMIKSRHNQLLDENLVLLLEGLVNACQNSHGESVKEMCDEISQHMFITMEQHHLLTKLVVKFN